MLTDKRTGAFFVGQGPFMQQSLLYSMTQNDLAENQ